MAKRDVKVKYDLDIDIAPIEASNEMKAEEELKEALREASKVAPHIKLRRTKKLMINKLQTPLYELEDLFIVNQQAKNNTEETIKYYKACFKMIYSFLGFHAPDTFKDYEKIINEYGEKFEFGKILPIVYLEMDDFDFQYRDFLKDIKKLSEQTINKELRGYRAIVYFAMDNGWLDRRKITIKDVEPPIKNTYTTEEIERLIVRPDIDDFAKYRSWMMVCFFLATGMRVTSAISLKVGDIDLEEGYANVNIVKNRNPIRITLVKSIVPKLEEYIREWRSNEDGMPFYDEYLFCNPYEDKLTRDAASKVIATYNRSRGVQKTSIHLFRHTFAKNWILNGGDIIILQKMLGQKSLKMVTRYANLYAPDIKPKAEEHALLNNVQPRTGRMKLQRRGGKA